nr:myelin protein zero-like protein 2 isoform X1 [Pogona vitticeps]
MTPPARGLSGPRWVAVLLPPLLGLWPVTAIEIYTPGSLEALNGTDVRLKCTFHSHIPVGRQLTVSWNFQSQTKSRTDFVLYYHEEIYPPLKGHFMGRVTWDGNVFKNDASIMIWNVNPSDNGTFQCQVKNPPDVDGVAGEIQLSVVMKVSFSEIHILALTIGIACAVMIVIVVVIVIFRHRRRVRQDKKLEVKLPEKEKLKEVPEEKEMSQLGEEA